MQQVEISIPIIGYVVNLSELRAQIGRANISQSHLARLAYISNATVTNLLAGRNSSLETVIAVINGLNRGLVYAGESTVEFSDIVRIEVSQETGTMLDLHS